MRQRHVRTGIVAVGSLLLAAAPLGWPARSAPPPTGDGDSGVWSREPAEGFAGFGRYAAGEWIYQDFVYDDGEQANNTADIVEIRAASTANDLRVRVTLNSLVDAASTVIGIAIGDPTTTESREWPAGAGVSSPWTSFATVTSDSVTLTDAGGRDQQLAAPAVNLDENTFELALPGLAHGNPRLVLNIGAGAQAESSSGASWAGVPIDLAFNTHAQEGTSSDFRDDAQQAAIDSGDVSAFSQTVDVHLIRSRATVDPPIENATTYNRVYRSSQQVGEGYGDDEPTYRGLYQPYAFWLPPDYESGTPVPLLLVMHSLGQIHNQYDTGQYYPQVAGTSGAIAFTPLAMGTGGWYWDEALVDTLDAWVDVVDHYAIDSEQVYSAGYSMGGYGTYRMATLFPELLAGAVSWVGPPTDGIWAGTDVTNPPGLTYHQLESVQHIPFYIVHGTNDELVPVTGVTRQAQKLHDLGYEYRYALHPGQDHFSFAVINNWQREADWLEGRTRVVDPARVTFDVRPEAWVSRTGEDRTTILDHIDRLAGRLGARRDAAYWVSDIRVAGQGEGDVTGTVALVSHGIAARTPVTEEITTVGEVRPGYGSTLGPSPHVLRGIDRTWEDEPVDNVLSGTLTGITELSVDLQRAGLTLDGLDLQVESDGPVTLHLLDGDRTETVSLG